MSRNFRSGEFVSHGSAAGLDNLMQTSGGVTLWGVVLRGANTAGSPGFIMSKDAAFPEGWNWSIDGSASPGEGALLVRVERATVNCNVISVAGVVALYVPTFVAFTFNAAASPAGKSYSGTEAAAVAETSYNTQTDGSGTPVADATANFYVGNLQRATTNYLRTSIQMGGVITGSTLSAAQLDTIWQAAIASDDPSSAILALFTHELMFDYRAGSLADRTGNGHTGTATGAQAGFDFPDPANIATGGGLLVHPGMAGGMRG